jgi:phosphoglycerate dehydrogenase-like enzyme
VRTGAPRELPRPEGLWPGRLRWVLSASAGVDFYPPWLLDAPLVTCGRGTASDEIADYVIAAIYLRAKDLDGARIHSAAQWRYQPLGRVIGATVGIVGLGAIGRAVAARALALGAQVVAVRRGSGDADVPAGVELLGSVEAVVERADHIVIAVPATPQTHHLFDARLFARVKPGRT